MNDISGTARIEKVWQGLRTAVSHEERQALIADGICAASRMTAAVHQARRIAVEAVRFGAEMHVDTLALVQSWAEEYDRCE